MKSLPFNIRVLLLFVRGGGSLIFIIFMARIHQQCIEGMQLVRLECDRILSTRLCAGRANRSSRLEEFTSVHRAHTETVGHALRDSWPVRVANGLDSLLRMSNRSAFNLDEAHFGNYEASQLRSVMNRVKLMMQVRAL